MEISFVLLWMVCDGVLYVKNWCGLQLLCLWVVVVVVYDLCFLGRLKGRWLMQGWKWCVFVWSVGWMLVLFVFVGGELVWIVLIEGMLGLFVNVGVVVECNLCFGVEQVNVVGGVKLCDGVYLFEFVVFDSKGSLEEVFVQLCVVVDCYIGFVVQGNSLVVVVVFVVVFDKLNVCNLDSWMLFLNYLVDDLVLIGVCCSFWYFCFDVYVGMWMVVFVDVMVCDCVLCKVYLLNQDYSFGYDVSIFVWQVLVVWCLDVMIVGDEFYLIGWIKDFLLYIVKICVSGVDVVVIGNWGNDFMLFVKVVCEQGFDVKFYMFYGNSFGVLVVLGDVGVGCVVVVVDWYLNVGGVKFDVFYCVFWICFLVVQDDYLVWWMSQMIEMLVVVMICVGLVDLVVVVCVFEGLLFDDGFYVLWMCVQDYQLIQFFYVMDMDKVGVLGVCFDNEGLGYGFWMVFVVLVQCMEMLLMCLMMCL